MTELRTRPSSAHIWRHCAGSVQMSAPVPEEESAEAAEGHAAHWLAVELIAGRDISAHKWAPNLVPTTDEMVAGAYLFRDTVAPWLDGAFIEFPVKPPSIGARLPAWTRGTPDAQRFRNTTLNIADYKYGFRSVDAFENEQMTVYAINALDSLCESMGLMDWDITVVFEIVQPRDYSPAGKVKRWSCRGDELRGIANRLAEQSRIATEPNPPLKVGPYCIDCKGRARCEALRSAGASALQYVQGFIASDLTPAQIGHELTLLSWFESVFESRKAGLEALAESQLRAGQRVPGWSMSPGRSATVWTVPDDVAIGAVQLAGHDISKPREAITPIQAKDKGVPAEVVDALSKKVPGKLKLTRENHNEAKKVFKV